MLIVLILLMAAMPAASERAKTDASTVFDGDNHSGNNPSWNISGLRFKPTRPSLPPDGTLYDYAKLFPEAAREDRERYSLTGTLADRVVSDGCSNKALWEAHWLIYEMMRYAPISLLRRMLEVGKVTPIIIPSNKRLGELPQASGVRNKVSEDGRKLSNLTGLANVPQADGGTAMFVGEENLVEHRGFDGFHAREIFVHEWGHMVQLYGLTSTQWKTVSAVYDEATKDGHFRDSYASRNKYEFFAQMTAAWFDVHGYDGRQLSGYFLPNLSARWIQEQPSLKQLTPILHDVYGSPRKIRP